MILRLILLALPALLAGGCATTAGSLLALRGRPLMVVDEGGDGAAEREASLIRGLSLLPLRVWPSDAEPKLLSRLDGAERRALAGQEAAETRRVPWLLLRGPDGARVVTARGGRVLWEGTLRGRTPPAEQVRDQLLRALLARGEKPGVLDPRSTRLAPEETLQELRRLALAGSWQDHGVALRAALEQWPADPSLRVHEGLATLLSGGGSAGLERARDMNPEGGSELLALALLAEAGENPALALAARQQLVRLYPGRLDYLPELADLVAQASGPEAALGVLAHAREGGRPASLERVPSTAFPHDLPDGLPWADLAFSQGWYLAQQERWEQAALTYEEAEDLYERFDRRVELGDTLNNAGVAMVRAERPLIAARTFGRALLVRSGGDPVKAANSRYNQGRAYDAAGRTLPALRTLRTAAREYSMAGRRWDAIEARVETLPLLVKDGDREGMEQAGEDILWDLDEAEHPADRAMEARGDLWFELGRGRLTFGDPDGSLEAYARSLEVWRGAGRIVEQGQVLYSMALPHLAKFDFAAAFDDLIEALRIAVSVGDSSSIAAIRAQVVDVRELVRKSGGAAVEVPADLKTWLQ